MAQQQGGNLMMYALLGVGGWFVYTWMRDSGMLAEAGVMPSEVTVPAPPQTPAEQPQQPGSTAPPPPAPTLQNMRARVLNAAGANSGTTYNFWQWNYFYEQVSNGEPAADPFTIPTFQGKSIPEVESMLLTYDEWAGYMTQAGYSGLSGLGTYGYAPQARAAVRFPVSYPWSQAASAQGGIFDRG